MSGSGIRFSFACTGLSARRTQRKSAVLAGWLERIAVGLGLWLMTATGWGALPEAIVPTNSLPPAAGRYELYPPTAYAKWEYDIVYDGTNMPIKFHLNRIKAGPFTNIVRSVSGNDQVLEFDAVMETHVPVWQIGEWDEGQVALYDQLGHFRVRVLDRAVRSTGRFSMVVESFSWRLTGHDDEGNQYELFHVRLLNSPASTGWITVTNLADGAAVMQSEILLYPEGAWFEVSTNYYPTVSGPLRLALRGTSRTLQTLSVQRVTITGGDYVLLDNSHLGDKYLYGLDYTTNGVSWQAYSVIDFWGKTNQWFDSLESYSQRTASAPMTWFRLKARLRP